MKLLKIGRSTNNDIVVNDPTVSSQHAIISILDSREVKIKDLNSLNGTFVNGKRISGEATITANDVVKVGNATLDWLKYVNKQRNPAPPPAPAPAFVGDPSSIKRRKTIGRLTTNDIVLNHSDVSGSHAQLIQRVNGDIVIADNGSTNGTYVNGQKVSTQVLRAGDKVLIARKYPLDWENIFGKNTQSNSKKLKTILISTAAVAAVVVGVLLFLNSWWTPERVYERYRKSVVMIEFAYYYQVFVDGEYIGNYAGLTKNNKGNVVAIISKEVNPRFFGGTGTGFIVSTDGKIITNRHIVAPWNYSTEDQKKEIDVIKRTVESLLANALLGGNLSLFPKVGKVTVEGKMYDDYFGIYMNDTHKSENTKIPCHIIKDSGSDNIDIGVIQVSSKSLPNGIKRKNIVDLTKAVVNDKEIKGGNVIYLMGFPFGEALAETSTGIQADHQKGEITQVGDEYSFRHNAASFGGASGSPVFNQRGRLIGVHHAGHAQRGVHGYNYAIKAKYAVELAK